MTYETRSLRVLAGVGAGTFFAPSTTSTFSASVSAHVVLGCSTNLHRSVINFDAVHLLCCFGPTSWFHENNGRYSPALTVGAICEEDLFDGTDSLAEIVLDEERLIRISPRSGAQLYARQS